MLPKSLQRYFRIEPVTTPGASAAAYVPFVILARALAFLRLLIVAHLLGNAGQEQFGIYQPALEFINWIVPLVMFGLADVIERYAARFERGGQLRAVINRHLMRILIIGGCVAAALIVPAPWLTDLLFKFANFNDSFGLMTACVATVLLLAIYQYTAGLLRGLRAYSASAGLETSSAILLLIFSTLAALQGKAISLLIAYSLSLLLPLIVYLILLKKHLHQLPPNPDTTMSMPTSSTTPVVLDYETPPADAHLSSFARWTLLRLLFVMTFGFLALWSVNYLSRPTMDPAPFYNYRTYAQEQTARFSMPYRIAQLLAYLAVTLWSSSYGIAATAWSHGQIRRAKVQLFRVGKFGALLMTLAALTLLLTRSLFAALLPTAYNDAILNLLPPMLALFIWYGLLSFSSVYADLQEKPHLGATLWGTAIVIQITLILIPLTDDPLQHALLAATLALALPLFLLAPLLLCRPFKFAATAVPLVLLSLAPITLFSPPWVVDWIAAPAMLAAIAFLFMARLLIRPIDRRAFRRWRSHQHIVSQS